MIISQEENLFNLKMSENINQLNKLDQLEKEIKREKNPQHPVIRGHCRGCATLFSFGVEIAAPHTSRRGQLLNCSQEG